MSRLKKYHTDRDSAIMRLITLYKQATPDEVQEGRDWYYKEGRLCRKLAEETGVSYLKVAGVMAILSANTMWTTNKSNCEKIVKHYADGGKQAPRKLATKPMNKKAWAVLVDGDFSQVRGPKVIEFFNNLRNPKKFQQSVTVDRWAWRSCIGELPIGKIYLPQEVIEQCQEWYVEASRLVGELPMEFQAITWLTIRRVAREAGYWKRVRANNSERNK
jgi:hypothetical protein